MSPGSSFRIDGTLSLVTGAASGIGRATAWALARCGGAVAVLDRDEAELAALVDQLAAAGFTAAAYCLDLARLELIPDTVAAIVSEHGPPDHLVNCAGVTGRDYSILDLDLTSWDEVHTINLKAPLILMQEVARRLVASGKGGRIVNVSSSSSFKARMSPLGYASSKAALNQLTRSAAATLGPLGINVNAVAPGVTRSAITARLGDDDALRALVSGEGPLGNLRGELSDPEDVAAAIVFLCCPGSRHITGQVIHTSAGAVV